MHHVELEARRLWERRLLESRYFSRSPSRLCGRAVLERFSYFHAASKLVYLQVCFPAFVLSPHFLCLSMELSHLSPIFYLSAIFDAKKVFVTDTDAHCKHFVRLFQAS